MIIDLDIDAPRDHEYTREVAEAADFCAKCADLGEQCDVHRRPRRKADAITCGSKKCVNALRYLAPDSRRRNADA